MDRHDIICTFQRQFCTSKTTLALPFMVFFTFLYNQIHFQKDIVCWFDLQELSRQSENQEVERFLAFQL